MGSNENMSLALPIFQRFDLVNSPPISMLFQTVDPEARCGIYVLEFADGARYVGQTVNIVNRFSQHRRTYNDIVAMSFASCAENLLDVFELLVIKKIENDFSLRNKKLTDLPGGHDEVTLQMVDGFVLQLPWKRENRGTVFDEPKGSKNKRFWKLAGRADYPEIKKQLARYVHETIPKPTATGGSLWSLTALPSTSKRPNRHRLFTLNAGSMEVLYLIEHIHQSGTSELEWRINLWPEGLAKKLKNLSGDWVGNAFYGETDAYKSAGSLIAISSFGTSTFGSVLEQEFILAAAYRLNVMLMRRSTSVYAKFHNEALAFDVLKDASFIV